MRAAGEVKQVEALNTTSYDWVRAHPVPPGRAVQVDPMKPKLKPPRCMRLKLKCDILLSTSAFKFNWRRYIPGNCVTRSWTPSDPTGCSGSASRS